MCNGVGDRLLPGEGRILEPFDKQQVVEHGALPHVFLDQDKRFVKQPEQRMLDARPAHDVEFGASTCVLCPRT